MEMRSRDLGLRQSERAECNMGALVRHDRAEIDKWMFRSEGIRQRRRGQVEKVEWM